jgi:uncharacterized membrane protein YeaQ/YmgE (transglycosylase-associated protein family)
MLVIGLVEALGHKLFPIPQEITQTAEMQDTEALFALISPEILLFVLLAYIIGSFIGGFIASLIGKQTMLAVISGSVLMLGGVINLFMIPHPIWFVLVSMLVYIPFALIGGLLAKKVMKHSFPK